MSTTGESAATASSATPQSEIDAKIMADLDTVVEKIDLCDSMLQQRQVASAGGNGSTPNTEELLTVIGFLEACAPRMVELVEVAAQGALSEHVLMKCLEVNDRLTKTLDDVDKTVDENEADKVEIQPSATTSSRGDNHVDLLSTNDAIPAAPMTDSYTTVGGASAVSTASSIFRASGTSTTEGSSTLEEDRKPPAVGKSKSEEEFDSFFSERTTSGNSG